MISSEFTHANPAHIIFNMSGLLVFGVDVEKMYGTAYYMAINFALIAISTVLSLGFYALMAFCIPVIYRGGPQNFYNCGVGYSNVLFGLAMIFSYVGDPYVNLFGMCRQDKKLVPWLYMLMIYFTIPDSSFLGHFCGLLAGLLIKFGGINFFMPRFTWIHDFDLDRGLSHQDPSPIGYFPAKPEIKSDFDGYLWSVAWNATKNAVLKVRHRLFGYEYVSGPPEPVICPNAIELEDRRASSTRVSINSDSF